MKLSKWFRRLIRLIKYQTNNKILINNPAAQECSTDDFIKK